MIRSYAGFAETFLPHKIILSTTNSPDIFLASAKTLNFSLTKLLRKRPETLILPLTIKNCPECCT